MRLIPKMDPQRFQNTMARGRLWCACSAFRIARVFPKIHQVMAEDMFSIAVQRIILGVMSLIKNSRGLTSPLYDSWKTMVRFLHSLLMYMIWLTITYNDIFSVGLPALYSRSVARADSIAACTAHNIWLNICMRNLAYTLLTANKEFHRY